MWSSWNDALGLLASYNGTGNLLEWSKSEFCFLVSYSGTANGATAIKSNF
jgi:hypothetical protein